MTVTFTRVSCKWRNKMHQIKGDVVRALYRSVAIVLYEHTIHAFVTAWSWIDMVIEWYCVRFCIKSPWVRVPWHIFNFILSVHNRLKFNFIWNLIIDLKGLEKCICHDNLLVDIKQSVVFLTVNTPFLAWWRK